MALKDFKSDGCTMAPDEKFFHCCKDHDFGYSEQSSMSRLDADNRLFTCILDKANNPLSSIYYFCIASTYWAFVRIFGASRYKKK